MSKYSLKDILKNKKPGDEWYTLAAPEEILYWDLRKPWEKDFFKNRGVTPLSISFRTPTADKIEDFDKKKYNGRNPLRFKCGVEMVGFVKTTTKKEVQGTVRIDSAIELNNFMEELCSKYGIGRWEIFNICVYNSQEGVESVFKIHNPDGHGPGFFLFRIFKGKDSRLYPDIALNDQYRYVAKFYSNLSHCTAVERKDVAHGCALEKKITKKQIVRRSKKT
jgi:hypothetical protein